MKGYTSIKIESMQQNEITFSGAYLKSYKFWLTTIKAEKVQ